MSKHPEELKKVVESGRSIIYKGRVVNNLNGAPMPSLSELVGAKPLRNQVALDLERRVAEMQKEIATLKSAPAEVEASQPDEVGEVKEISPGSAGSIADIPVNERGPRTKK